MLLAVPCLEYFIRSIHFSNSEEIEVQQAKLCMGVVEPQEEPIIHAFTLASTRLERVLSISQNIFSCYSVTQRVLLASLADLWFSQSLAFIRLW